MPVPVPVQCCVDVPWPVTPAPAAWPVALSCVLVLAQWRRAKGSSEEEWICFRNRQIFKFIISEHTQDMKYEVVGECHYRVTFLCLSILTTDYKWSEMLKHCSASCVDVSRRWVNILPNMQLIKPIFINKLWQALTILDSIFQYSEVAASLEPHPGPSLHSGYICRSFHRFN